MEDRLRLVALDDVREEATRPVGLVRLGAPRGQHLVEEGALHEVLGLVLLPELDEGLVPMPEVLGLLDLADLLNLLAVELLAEFMLLKRAEVPAKDLQLVTADADPLELAEDYMLLQTVEGDLKHVRLLLDFDMAEVILDQLLVVLLPIRRNLQLDEDRALHLHLASLPERMEYLLHQEALPEDVEKLDLIVLHSPLRQVINDLKSIGLLDKAREERVRHSAIVLSLEHVGQGLETAFEDQAFVPLKHAFALQVLPSTLSHRL